MRAGAVGTNVHESRRSRLIAARERRPLKSGAPPAIRPPADPALCHVRV